MDPDPTLGRRPDQGPTVKLFLKNNQNTSFISDYDQLILFLDLLALVIFDPAGCFDRIQPKYPRPEPTQLLAAGSEKKTHPPPYPTKISNTRIRPNYPQPYPKKNTYPPHYPKKISDTRIRPKYPRPDPDPQQCMLGFTFMFYCLVKEPSFTIIFVLVVISCRPGVATDQGCVIWLSGNMSYVTSSKDVSIWSRLRRLWPVWFQVSRCYGPGQNLVIGWCFIPYRLKTLRKRLFLF